MELNKKEIFKTKRRISIYSMLVNSFLATIKLIGGILASSSVLIADAIHSFSDLAASFSVFIGIIISNRKNKNFPYGLYKVENLVAIISSFAIFMAGYEIARDVLFSHKLKTIKSLPLAISVVIITLVVTFLFSNYEKKIGTKINSPSIIADSEHVKTDMLSSLVVLIGIVAQYFMIIWLEKIAVVIVVLLILHSGFEILKESIKVLLDASIDANTQEQIKKILLEEPLVAKINSITGRNSGSYIFIELDLNLATNSLEEAHNFSEYIENKIKTEIPFVEKVLVHYAEGHKNQKIAILAHQDGRICKSFGQCPNIFIFEKNGQAYTQTILANPVANLGRKKGIELMKFLKSHNITCLVMQHLPESEAVLELAKSYFIDLVTTDKNNLDELDIENLACK